MSGLISWIHFGDLHISEAQDPHLEDFRTLIDEANRYMGGIDFALLPGDNADDGEEDQYRLVQAAIERCRFPVHAISGDHDVAGGSLELFRKYLSPSVYWSMSRDKYHFVFLNSLAVWHPPVFGLGLMQMEWLRADLKAAISEGLLSIIFMHAYPTEHGEEAGPLRALFAESKVILVEMGHTHYNELANDGSIVYATTRSTGQVEEGPPGFSVTTLDDGIVSWHFKPIGEWPLVTITSPADHRMMIDTNSPQIVRGVMPIRARIWGPEVRNATVSVDGGKQESMIAEGAATWSKAWDFSDAANGKHTIEVTAQCADGRSTTDRISALVNQAGEYEAPARRTIDYENALDAWPEKHLLGTQLGPNENGRHWPSKRVRKHTAR